jgi:hypothetical protein
MLRKASITSNTDPNRWFWQVGLHLFMTLREGLGKLILFIII